MPYLPVPAPLRRRLWYPVIGSMAFLVTSCAEAARRPDYDAWHQALSALSLGPRGWVQMINFLVLAAIILSTVAVWRRILRGGTGGMAVPALTALTGVSFVVCGLMPQDPAPGYDPMGLNLTAPTLTGSIHLAFAGLAALGSIGMLFVMARRYRETPGWDGWSGLTRCLAAAMIVAIVVYGVWSRAPAGYAGTFERAALLIPTVWAAAFLRRLGKGAPFMLRA